MDKNVIVLFHLLFLALLVVVFSVDASLTQSSDLIWQIWKERHTTHQHQGVVDHGYNRGRRDSWQFNVDQIDKHNLRFDIGLETYRKSVNQFSDLTWHEFEATYLTPIKIDQFDTSDRSQAAREDAVNIDDELPVSIDWREKGYVTEVKNQMQNQCSSSWAFAPTGALEGQLANATKQRPISLSVQQLLDCDLASEGCRIGSPVNALEYTRDNGIELWNGYNYTAVQGNCRYNASKVVFKNSGLLHVLDAGELRLAQMLVHRGPISVCIHATSDFWHYSSGIFTTDQCVPGFVNHCMLLVGYDVDYWLVKNSWGMEWGDEGYVKMARNQGDPCNLALTPLAVII